MLKICLEMRDLQVRFELRISGSKLDKFSRDIEMIGDLEDEQKQRLLEIADKCPVHKTLESNVVIETSLKSS
ncbi:hypothetical protein BH20ACI2_BH20ACI2_04760 [soil metagenome]